MRSFARWWFVVALLGATACDPVVDNTVPAIDCEPGFVQEGSACVDEDECATGAATCGASASCINVTGTYACTCDEGFIGDGTTCTDFDECAINNGNCAGAATCVNEPGGRTCSCPSEFVGDGETCTPIWVRVGAVRGANLGQTPLVTSVGARIYFARESADPAAQSMRYFDTATNVASGTLPLPPPPNDLSETGLGPVFVGDTSGASLLGDDGMRYDEVGNVWNKVPGYTVNNQRGEAVGVYDDKNAAVLIIGGRIPSNENQATALRYSPASGAITVEPGQLPTPFARGAATSPSGTGMVYLVTGEQTPKFYSHMTGSAVWTPLPGPPAGLRASYMGDFEGKLWVMDRGTAATLHLFDLASGAWRPGTVALPMGAVAAATTTTGTYALVQASALQLEIHKLNVIE